MFMEKWQLLVGAIKMTKFNAKLSQELYVKVLSRLLDTTSLPYQDNADFEGKGVELVIDLHARYMPALASNLIKLFVQWLMIAQEDKETVKSFAAWLRLVSQRMARAEHKMDDVIQSLRLLWGLDFTRLGPIYERFFVGNDKDVTKMSYKQVVEALQGFETQFPGVQYPHYKKVMEKRRIPNLENMKQVRSSGQRIGAATIGPETPGLERRICWTRPSGRS